MANHFLEAGAENYMNTVFQTIYPCVEKGQIIKWLRKAPVATTLRISLESIAVDDFISQLKKLLPETFLVSLHPIVNDVVLIQSTLKRKEHLPSANKLVVVGSLCAAAVLRGADVYAPGVQATPAYLQIGDVVSIFGDVRNKVLKGAKTDSWVTSSSSIMQEVLFIGEGIATMSRDDLFKVADDANETLNDIDKRSLKKSGVAIKVTQSLSDCPRLSDQDCISLRDKYLMQNLPSTLCGHILNPKPDEKILDMCAAPGGKTSHLASLLKRQCLADNLRGKIYACDRSQSKVDQINDTCCRLRVSDMVEAFVQDGTKIKFEGIFQKKSFDKILLDGPCSGQGQRPQFLQEKTLKELWSYSNLQKKLFSKAVELLKVGGILVYSTCTLTLEENEELVAWALNEFPQLSLETPSPCLGSPGVQVPGLTIEDSKKLQRFGNPEQTDPINDTIGFFIAKFVIKV